MTTNLIVCLLLALCSSYAAQQSANAPFRISRLNTVWNKALQIVPAEKLNALRADLTQQDRIELDAKHRKDDQSGVGAADLEIIAKHHFSKIIERYGLDGVLDGEGVMSNELPEDGSMDSNQHSELRRKMDKIWRRASDARLPEADMNKLREKFMQQKAIVDDFERLKKEVERLDELTTNGKVDRRVYDDKNAELKNKYKMMRRGYDEMEQFAGVLDDPTSAGVEFTEPKVIDLWLRTRGMGLPPSTLEQVKRELGQLEQRIKKQSHFQNELRLRETELREETNRADHKANDEVNRLREKVNELNFQIKKLHTDLKNRVERLAKGAHSEL